MFVNAFIGRRAFSWLHSPWTKGRSERLAKIIDEARKYAEGCRRRPQSQALACA